MKKYVTISLFIFWAVVTAVLAAGLVFYQQRSTNCSVCPALNNFEAASGTAPADARVKLDQAEIAKHNQPIDCWLLIDGKVYAVSDYITQHPGGSKTIAANCGQDASQGFATKGKGQPHSANAQSMLKDYYIGDLNQMLGASQVQSALPKTGTVVPTIGVEEGEYDFEDD